ncbi:MAG: tRNA pseudouridine(38-40) synthase TruA [Rhodanobacteraceae bacterium]|nr:tRNA pseudouridine(38-40) synthase TruA [Rhodanobacteraceae bacterium]
MTRYALAIEYDGSRFHGWQTQRDRASVQATLEAAIAQVAHHPVAVVAAGRTDTGVHAQFQVVHFDSDAERVERAWLLGTNTHLPKSAVARWVMPVNTDFHARFSARSRRYRYTIVNRLVRPAIGRERLSWIRKPLDVEAMQAASRCLLGIHDFTSFRTVACQAHSPVRDLRHIEFSREADLIHMDIEANGFLHHMVRNIIGSLMLVGHGEQSCEWIAEVLAARDRTRAGITGPPEGLVFIGPRYERAFGLPDEVSL